MNAEFVNHPTAGPTLLRTQLFSSWANQHCADGSFYYYEFLARRNVLGGSNVGFWGQVEPSISTTTTTTGPFHASGTDGTGFRNGQMLLEKSFPKLAKGWTSSLKANEYPSGPPKKPLAAQQGGLLGWKDYIEFRGLSPTTIAPLLLNNVLTVYQMIYHELKLHEKKKPLKVFLLGVEIELNQIPLFEELLHVLPAGVDLELILVSPAVKDVCDQAAKLKSDGKTVIASQEYVLDLTDPVAKGRVRVRLHEKCCFYHEIPFENSKADAVLALSAGLGSYDTWGETVHRVLRQQIPFLITDQCMVTLRYNEKCWFPWFMDRMKIAYPHLPQLVMPILKTKLNPFHGIVNRDVSPVGVPNIRNGYIMQIEK